jgi:DNA polymerase III epsilon subunit-like protein
MAFQYSLFPEQTPKIAIVDIETTGFLNQKGLIVEIGIVSLDLHTGEINTEFDSLIREPGFNKAHTTHPYGWIFQNSDLKYDQVSQAPQLFERFNEIQAILDKYPTGITAYNASFDLPFLRSRSFAFTPLPCPMIAATPVVNLPPFPGRSSPKWPTVQETWNFLFGDKTGYIETHRAADDARHEAKIVHELYKRGKYSLP